MVQAHVGVRFLRESLDEEQLVEIQQRIGEHQLAHGPPRVEVDATSLGLGRIAGQCAQPLLGLIQSAQVRRHVHAALAQMRGQFAAALDAGSRREIQLPADLGGRPRAEAGLIGRLAQRHVLGRICRPVDFDFIEVEEDRLAAGYLQPHEPGLQFALREDDFERRGTGNATEMAALVVVARRPLLAVVRSQDDKRVGIVQARSVVETVVDDDPRDGLHAAEVHLPPRIRVPSGVERVLAILDAVDGAGRVALSGQRFDERLQPVLLDQLAESAAGHHRFARSRGVWKTVHRRRGVNRNSAQRVPHETGQPNGGQTVSWALFRVATDS